MSKSLNYYVFVSVETKNWLKRTQQLCISPLFMAMVLGGGAGDKEVSSTGQRGGGKQGGADRQGRYWGPRPGLTSTARLSLAHVFHYNNWMSERYPQSSYLTMFVCVLVICSDKTRGIDLNEMCQLLSFLDAKSRWGSLMGKIAQNHSKWRPLKNIK